jgi:hypothetical protein
MNIWSQNVETQYVTANYSKGVIKNRHFNAAGNNQTRNKEKIVTHKVLTLTKIIQNYR